MFAIVAVFIAGLMVGRTPEYLGKKIEAYEMKMASLVDPRAGRGGARRHRARVRRPARPAATALANPGPHGFSEILYAFSSTGNNNGSRVRRADREQHVLQRPPAASAMFVARYWIIIPMLAIAGSLARKKIVPPSPGTLPTA